MSDDELKDDDPRLTPLDHAALRAVRGRARKPLSFFARLATRSRHTYRRSFLYET